MPGNQLRQVVESHRFAAERDKISGDIERWDRILFGVVWTLSRKPAEAGRPTANLSVRALATAEWPGAPPLVIYYSFNDQQVELLSVIVAQGGGE